MKIYRNFVALALFFSLFGAFLLFALLWLYDPYVLFHKPYFREDSYGYFERAGVKRIIDENDFDSVILGTSMLQNTSAKEASQRLGGKWINISLSSSSPYERLFFFRYILKTKELKNIMTSFDNILDFYPKNVEPYEYLYDDNYFNDFKAYLNDSVILCALRYSSSRKCVGRLGGDAEDYTKWVLNETKTGQRFGGFENWILYNDKDTLLKLKNSLQESLQENFTCGDMPNLQESKDYVQKYMLDFIKENPKINFYIVFPPYSKLFYKSKNMNGFCEKKALVKWFLEQSAELKNVKFYGFDLLDYTENIANYTDAPHYNVDMNSLQLQAIEEGKHILDKNNVDLYFKEFENKIKNYDISPLIKALEEADLEY